MIEEKKTIDFDALKLTLASPDVIHNWSHGQVEKPETVNYRTQKPEKGGLFAEEIFGPSKDWECYCGKYKKIRYKGIVCDKCGVEVTRSVVRRERMGHIDLAAPCSHIWFLRGVPSKIGLILDLSPQSLEKVIYFADFIITSVDDDLKKETLEQIRLEFKNRKKKIISDFGQQLNVVKSRIGKDREAGTIKPEQAERKIEDETSKLAQLQEEKIGALEEALSQAEQELKEIRPLQIITEHTFQDLSLKYGHIFEAGIGAEAVHSLLEAVDLDKLISELDQKILTAHGMQRDKAVKRLRLARNLKRSGVRPEWMILTVVPVIPPDLRPMVPLDGGRFATSDLNDLYRRIINRNNRLKHLKELNAPEVITRNEKRMLQEAVDALIDNNARHGKTVVASTGQKRMLKSLADVLKGKQGRFRQNLLGKRIDYSGRSVIVVGPRLQLHQCGLPKRMALELFKPFVISRLIREEFVHNVRSANRFIEAGHDVVWDILEDIVKDAYVLLNRAPTLHRLGIQAFKPILIEGKAIQIHPLVCEAFNADFDGDQMAVHVPLTEEARWEAEHLMLSSRNLLKPATGEPIARPSKDMIWGVYYMTMLKDFNEKPQVFADTKDALLAYRLRQIRLQERIFVRPDAWLTPRLKGQPMEGKMYETSIGRILFNQALPEEHPFMNEVIDSKKVRIIISQSLERYGVEKGPELLDRIKNLGLHYLTRSGFSWGMDDVPRIEKKTEIIKASEKEVEQVENQFATGLLTDSERHAKIIEIWMAAKETIVENSRHAMDTQGPVFSMVESGARGSWSQLIQIVGMKGLVTNPAGEIIELPVKGNFKEGFDVLEYFISTHGARKGLSDTALRTANAGYLTRRLIDVAQDMVITLEDCGDTEGFIVTRASSEVLGLKLHERVRGRFSAKDIMSAKGKKKVVGANELIDNAIVEELGKLELSEIAIRSTLTCRAPRGLCQRCYGWDLGHNRLAEIGMAAGIVAAQSIGEPGTQLTMRTFHTGGVAGLDITQGLPRVEEVFEVRPPKHRAFVSEVDGKISIEQPAGKNINRGRVVRVIYPEVGEDLYPLKLSGKKKTEKAKPVVKDGQAVEKGDLLFTDANGEKVTAKNEGTVKLGEDQVTITTRLEKSTAYQVPPEFHILVKHDDLVAKGSPLTDGSMDLRQLFRLRGVEAVWRYLIGEIQQIYTSQGQKLNDKHIEIIARQMFSRHLVTEPGTSDLLAGDRVNDSELYQMNIALKKSDVAVKTDRLLLGITKVALSTSSFLSAVSFQETSRVLINAAVEGKIDRLEGLKENVIIGRLIPAGTGYKGKR